VVVVVVAIVAEEEADAAVADVGDKGTVNEGT
jgi:hypothetical protein